jgi:pimeloyl-ACP methyl ester carboxylesterase
VLSLVSIMSTTGNRWKGQPALRVYPFFVRRPPAGREAYVKRLLKLFRLIGSPGFERDERELREMLDLSFERSADPAGMARQLGAIVAVGDRTPDLGRIEAPTLVIHGTKDRMIRPSGGRATVRAIPGARLLSIPGMGHDLPRGVWPRIIDGIAANAALAREEQPA